MQQSTPLLPHRDHSNRFLVHARDELAKGERLQASGKAWGAVAHALKDFADKRGWTYETTPHARELAHYISRRMDDLQVVACFDTAYGLHTNFYRDELTEQQIAARLDLIESLVDAVHQADQQIEPSAPEPQYSIDYKQQIAQRERRAQRPPRR